MQNPNVISLSFIVVHSTFLIHYIKYVLNIKLLRRFTQVPFYLQLKGQRLLKYDTFTDKITELPNKTFLINFTIYTYGEYLDSHDPYNTPHVKFIVNTISGLWSKGSDSVLSFCPVFFSRVV